MTANSQQPPHGHGIDAEEMKGLLFLLGQEMQQIPKGYREAVFKKLDARKAFLGSHEPKSIAPMVIDAFKAGWMNYA